MRLRCKTFLTWKKFKSIESSVIHCKSCEQSKRRRYFICKLKLLYNMFFGWTPVEASPKSRIYLHSDVSSFSAKLMTRDNEVKTRSAKPHDPITDSQLFTFNDHSVLSCIPSSTIFVFIRIRVNSFYTVRPMRFAIL